jgi:hypothetical protein
MERLSLAYIAVALVVAAMAYTVLSRNPSVTPLDPWVNALGNIIVAAICGMMWPVTIWLVM